MIGIDATRLKREDPMTEINKLKSELVLRKRALPLEMQDGAVGEEFEILQSDDGKWVLWVLLEVDLPLTDGCCGFDDR